MLGAVVSPAELSPVSILASSLSHPGWMLWICCYSWECYGRVLRNRIAVQALVLLRLGCTTLTLLLLSCLGSVQTNCAMVHWSPVPDWARMCLQGFLQ